MNAKTNQSDITNQMRLVRLHEVLRIVPISRSSWWQGVKTGRYPAPVKLGARTTCWRLKDIVELVERGA